MNLLKINLETQLAKQGVKNETNYQHIIDEANKLLELQEEDDKVILSRFGFDKNIEEAKKIQRDNRQRNVVLSKLDKKRIFTEDQIKSLCTKYGLRFLDAKRYRGEVDPLLPAKIREFENMWNGHFYKVERRNVGKKMKLVNRVGIYPPMRDEVEVDDIRWFLNGNEWDAPYYENEDKGPQPYSHTYKICAPASSFKLDKINLDPLMFAKVYETHDEVKYYYLVYKWGNDLSIFRYLTNLPVRTRTDASITLWLFATSFYYCVFNVFGVNGVTSLLCICWIILTIIMQVCISSDWKSNAAKWDGEYSE